MNHERPRIDILLPTWNGERFLQAQLASLLTQHGVSVRILVHDDSSDDGTWRLAQTCAARHRNIVLHTGPHVGVVGNVSRLLELSEHENRAGYFALCDQDDIWYPHKLARSMQAMRQLERRCGTGRPLLVCADARCVDAQGRPLHASFLRGLGLSPRWGHDLRQALVMSHALGCSCLGNAALRRLALPLPPADAIFMHDWWLLLVAACFGATHCISEPLLDYRQHEGNMLGVRKPKDGILQRLAASRECARRSQRQARTLLRRYENQMDAAALRMTRAWADMPETPWWLRQWLCRKHGFGKPGWARLWT